MDIILNIYSFLDSILIIVFRFPDNPLTGYYLGIVVLSFMCVIIGEYSMKLAFIVNKKNILRHNHEIDRYQGLSIEALKAGDKPAYKACNSIANDAFGKCFFTQIALSAASLWPVFIALGWMQFRFSGIEIRLPFLFNSYSFGYASTFITCYIAVRLISGKIRRTLHLLKDQTA
jgi:hypothetical protein